ncbi:MAG: acyl-CoA dehydrogenase family protein [Leptospiraceae bacterium]|nr:acyl-CoA dehydrogenase family protein [Leptospiraceae bacterium]MCK6381789.1 acyl-CoA dehydrogenase family protein [Leptospiraceae bacterium]
MIQSNYFTDNDDLQLQFQKIVNWDEVVKTYEGDFEDSKKYKETGDERYSFAPSTKEEALDYYQSVLNSLGEISGTEISQRAKAMDNTGLKYKDGKVTFPKEMIEAYNLVVDAGLHSFSMSRKFGGLGIPLSVQVFAMELVARADASLYIALSCVSLAETIERYGSEEMKEEWVTKMAKGSVTGAMALTEPNFGSDLPSVQTKAVKNPDGTYTLNGTKRFITHACGFADIPSVILTLARTGSPTSGARGLSFFLVESKDIQIAGIEKKMGLHCSPTCEVVYENTKGILIGEEGNGLVKYAMGMMNTARMSIAGQSLGIATAAAFEAKKYARERVQFGKTLENIPAVKKMLDRMDRELAAGRCLLLEAARTVDNYLWKTERLERNGVSEKEIRKDEEIRKWEKLANYFTPLAKYYLSELCISISFDAIQIHGGSGYTEDYDVAKIYKDSRITNIYEGTTQLQVVAAIGGVVSGMSPSGHLRAYIDETMSNFSITPELAKVKEIFETVVSTFKEIKDNTRKDTLAFETVETSARFIIGLLFEKSASKLSGEKREERLKLIKAYNQDSIAICEANKIKISFN